MGYYVTTSILTGMNNNNMCDEAIKIMKTMDEYKDYPDELLKEMTIDDINVDEPFCITPEDYDNIDKMFGEKNHKWITDGMIDGLRKKYAKKIRPIVW